MNSDATDALAVIRGCFEAIARQDVDALVAHYTEDYVLELPYYEPDEPLRIAGRERVRAYLAEALAVQQMELTLTGHHWIAGETLLIAEYRSRGRFLDTGKPYRNAYVGYWHFRGRLVRHLREYYNPQAPRASAIDPAA